MGFWKKQNRLDYKSVMCTEKSPSYRNPDPAQGL